MLQVAHEIRPKPGEYASGDAIVVRSEGRFTMLSLIDALGHGVRAASTAEVGVDYLRATSLDGGAHQLLDGLHHALAGTRGAAALVAIFDGSVLQYGGVGNVEMRVHGARSHLVNAPGILGHRIHRLHIETSTLALGSRVAIFSDGVRARFDLEHHEQLPISEVCQTILGDYARATDDASILVAEVVSDSCQTSIPN